MALSEGDEQASGGMSQAIYNQLDQLLSPKISDQKTLDEARKGWQQLAYAVAKGVVDHLKANAEITNVKVSGSATLPVSGGTATGSVTLDQTPLTAGKLS